MMDNPIKCPKCGHDGPHVVVLETQSVHHARETCAKCLAFVRWIAKPSDDPTKYKRPQKHRNLVAEYSRGFCEMCLRLEDDLPKGQTMEAQHVIEFQDGGSEKRENIWIVCTACHRMIHWLRTYHGRNNITLANQASGMKLCNESTLPTSRPS